MALRSSRQSAAPDAPEECARYLPPREPQQRFHKHKELEVRPFITVLTAAGIVLDRAKQEAHRSGRPLRLGIAEFQLLELFMSYPGVVFSREQLVTILWGTSADVCERTVDQKIARLRRALTLGHTPDPIVSVRGKGYKFSEAADHDYARWLQRGPEKLRLHGITA